MYKKILEISGHNILCSVNKKYYKNFSLTSGYRIFKKNIEAHSLFVDLDPPYTMLVEIHTRKDIDNCLKPIFDALQSKLGNDNQVLRLFVERVKITKRGLPERLIIYAATKNDLSFVDILKRGLL